jgi:hypothetical protein
MELDTLAGVHSAAVDADGNGINVGDVVLVKRYTKPVDMWETARVEAVSPCRCVGADHVDTSELITVRYDDGTMSVPRALDCTVEFRPASAFDDLEAPLFVVDVDQVDELDAVQLRDELRKAIDLIDRYRRDLAVAHERLVPDVDEYDERYDRLLAISIESLASAKLRARAYRSERDKLVLLAADLLSCAGPPSPRRMLAALDKVGKLDDWQPTYSAWLRYVDELDRTLTGIQGSEEILESLGGIGD